MAAEERDDWEPETEEEEGTEATGQQGNEVSDEDRTMLAAVKGSGMSPQELVARAKAHAAGERGAASSTVAEEEDDPERIVTAKEMRGEATRIADQRTRQAVNRMAIDSAIDEVLSGDAKFAALADEDPELRQAIEMHVGRGLTADPTLGSWTPSQFKARTRALTVEAIKKLRDRAARMTGVAEATEEPEELDRLLAAQRETGDAGRGGAGAGKRSASKSKARDESAAGGESDDDNLPFGDPDADWTALGRENEKATKKAVRSLIRRQTAGA
jgi:hypothetical protein